MPGASQFMVAIVNALEHCEYSEAFHLKPLIRTIKSNEIDKFRRSVDSLSLTGSKKVLRATSDVGKSD